MSLCDTCPSPGHCCRRLTLQGGHGEDHDRFRFGMTEEEAALLVTRYELPFVPFGTDAEGYALFTCPKLGNDGRCKIYDDRPDVCRNFEPGATPLCVRYQPKERDDDTIS